MRHVLKTIFFIAPLLPACGDSGQGKDPTDTGSGPGIDSLNTLGSDGASDSTASGGASEATTATTDGGSEGSATAATVTASEPTTTTATTGPDETTSTSTTFPQTASSLPDTTGFEPPQCDPVMKATVRDFRTSHPDFETFGGDAAYEGLVQQDLGPDSKPVYAHPGGTPQTTGPAEFAQWYNDTPDVNMAFEIDIPLTEVSPGQFTYQNNAFFPIDGQGWGDEGNPHNFHFTTEIHTEFTYQGGEVFTFTGDDDLWLFINGKLAIDLGGLHPQLTDTISLDENAGYLGITIGQNYTMDIFHAERHTTDSNFRIDTSIQCFVIPG
ncbi:fibro-slime domain-containing protein [Nannocystis bainbridge]|uniref:Fibro-slime domain-containing protein n=1 Tax=Nannocystis bainbridge TaxID=2995303 RepID=A0ABT5E116_9BACT|nr:fibro-slime domain-containing protein [Nannocystis bainbridge]MDC0718397.1 fibro-slime domain-containing protein [Nannocystis bainbridge]